MKLESAHIVIMTYGSFIILGIAYLLISIRGLTGKKPFLISYRRSLFFPHLFMFAAVLNSLVYLLLKYEVTRAVVVWSIVFFVVFIVFVVKRYMTFDYMVFDFGNKLSLKKLLHSSLTSLNIPYDETPAGIRLPTLGIDLLVKDNRKKFRMKQWRFNYSLYREIDRIVDNINEHLQNSPNVTIKPSACWKHVAGSGMIIIMSVAFILYLILQ